MIGRKLVMGLTVLGSLLIGGVGRASAQGLIWSLPEDGTWVRYEGTCKQTEFRPGSNEGDLKIEWIRHLELKSVGKETAVYDGQMTPCRWIEIKVLTGKPSEKGVDTGPVGARIFKLLVPENRVIGDLVDAQKIPVSYLPIVKGYRRIGEGQVKPIRSKALQVYPLISLLMHYKTLEAETDEQENPEIRLGPVTAKKYIGKYTMESPSSRLANEAAFWRSKDVPFGLAKWTVKMVREAKDRLAPRSAFKPVSEITVEMSAHASGNGAQSELVAPQ